MWECEVSTEIAAPVEAVYRYLADFPRHKEWSIGVAELEPITNGEIRVGSEFKAAETVPVKFVSFSRITALEPPRRIAWESWDNRTMRVEWAFEIEPVDGRTRLVQRARIQPTSLFGRVMLNLMRKRQVPGENRRSLDRIKATLEAGT